jgi:hypothetical protein
MAWRLVQQHPDRTTSVTTPQQSQEILKVYLSHVRPAQHHAMAGAQIDCPKKRPLGIPASDWHRRLYALL